MEQAIPKRCMAKIAGEWCLSPLLQQGKLKINEIQISNTALTPTTLSKLDAKNRQKTKSMLVTQHRLPESTCLEDTDDFSLMISPGHPPYK
jgi:hypothetical protein